MKIYFPAQCKCGHIFLEKYLLSTPNQGGAVGFCWCGFCRTRLDVYPEKTVDHKERRVRNENRSS